MSTPNIGWLYYKDYHQKNGDNIRFFQDAPEQKGDRRNDYFQQHYMEKNATILSEPFDVATSTQLQVVSMIEKLKFMTIYPGLTMGTGYTHETGELGEFKLGFFFDYSTGYPCVPGSTVKGCLRSVFPQKKREKVADKKEKYDYLASAIRELPEFSKEIIRENDLSDAFDEKGSLKRMQFIDFLEREIFDGEKCEKNEDGTYKVEKTGDKTRFFYKPLCVYERDIFFDGYIVSSDHPAIKRSTYQNLKPFIADDFITPHLNRKIPELSPFTNPVPLMFLKILPEVTIQFQFDLKDGLLTKKEKEKLFGRLLLDFGIGAKTNVGYGQFTENEPVAGTSSGVSDEDDRNGENPKKQPPIGTPDLTIAEYTRITGKYSNDQQYKAKIIEEKNAHFIIAVGDDCLVKSIENIERKFNKDADKRIKKGKSGNYKTLEVGDTVFIRMNDVEKRNFSVMPVWTD